MHLPSEPEKTQRSFLNYFQSAPAPIIWALVLVLFLSGCEMLQTIPGFKSDGWRGDDFGQFNFSIPPGMEKSSANTPGSHIAQYTNENMTVTFDDGAYAGEALDSLGKYANYTSQMELIHGKGVQVVSFDIPPGPGHRFDYATAASYRGIGLTVYVHCRSRDDYDLAGKIFRSVRFKLF